MKQISVIKSCLVVCLLTLAAIGQAQEVSTLYFLENAPMRHRINPAFQPVSNGYINFTPLGYSSFWIGNNSLTMSDIVYSSHGKTVTALHPEYGDRTALYNAFRKKTLRLEAQESERLCAYQHHGAYGRRRSLTA